MGGSGIKKNTLLIELVVISVFVSFFVSSVSHPALSDKNNFWSKINIFMTQSSYRLSWYSALTH